MDQAGWHLAKNLNVPANITLHHLPAYSPELNAIERLWLWIKDHELSNRIYQTQSHLWQAGMQAWLTLTPEPIKSVCRTDWLPRND